MWRLEILPFSTGMFAPGGSAWKRPRNDQLPALLQGTTRGRSQWSFGQLIPPTLPGVTPTRQRGWTKPTNLTAGHLAGICSIFIGRVMGVHHPRWRLRKSPILWTWANCSAHTGGGYDPIYQAWTYWGICVAVYPWTRYAQLTVVSQTTGGPTEDTSLGSTHICVHTHTHE